MRADDEPLVSLEELSSLLQRHEGPDRPRPERKRRQPPVLRRSALVAAAALLLGSGLGFGAASRLTPSGEAAAGRIGLGFVPDSGWTVLQSNADAVPQQPAFAIAANGPLHPEDDARGIRNSSGLPYATLRALPPDGIVIVATFTIPRSEPWEPEPMPVRRLPLRLRDATPFVEQATELRPDRPLGDYRLRARVAGRDIDIHFYFGAREPSKAMIVAAQRQLDRLVVQPDRRNPKVEQRALPLQRQATSTPVTALAKVVDRTLVCTAGIEGGARNILPSSQDGYRQGTRFKWLAQASIMTPGNPLPSHPDHLRTLVGLTAGWPPPPGIRAGGVGYSTASCKPTRATVPFSTRGLSGGPSALFGDVMQCLTPTRVVIRLRAVFRSPTTLKLDARRKWIGATARIDRGELAVQTLNGKRLVYADVLDAGNARIFTKGCN